MVENLKQQVEKRLEELKEEYGSYEDYEIEINEILRDEFQEEDYEDILIELGINDSEEELGLQEEDISDDIGEGKDEADKDNIIKTLLRNNSHVFKLAMTLLGYEAFMGEWEYKGKPLIPKRDVKFMIEVISNWYQPQSLSGKLQNEIKKFDHHLNTIVNNFRIRLTNYPDDVCSATEMRIAIDLFLSHAQIIRNAIITGRIGDLTRDMSINSYNEKQDISNADDKIKTLKHELGIR